MTSTCNRSIEFNEETETRKVKTEKNQNLATSDVQKLADLTHGNTNAEYMDEISADSFINAVYVRELQALGLAGKKTVAELLESALAYDLAKNAYRSSMRIGDFMACKDYTCNNGRLHSKDLPQEEET